MRVMVRPGYYAQHYFQKWRGEYAEYRRTAYFRKLKDKYKGQRGFVVGNGPSLKIEDLSKLEKEVSIASNKIFMIFKDTPWRPQVYSIVDDLV